LNGSERGGKRFFNPIGMPTTKEAGPLSEGTCPACGSVEIEEDGPYCSICSSRFARKDPVLFDTMVIISIIAVTTAFILLPKPFRGLQGLDIPSLDGSARILMLAALLPVFISIILKFKQIMSIHQWKNLVRTVIPIIIIGPAIPLFTGWDSAEGIVLTAIFFMIGLCIALISRKEIIRTGPFLWALSLTSVLVFELGLSDSAGVISLPEGPWIMDGHFLALFGIIGFLGVSFLIMRSSDLETIEGVPVLLWMIGTIMVCLVLFIGTGIGRTSFSFLLGNSMLILCTSTITMAARRDMERVIFRAEKDMGDFVSRGKEHIVQDRPFYGLQQLDLALRRNPCDGFGRPEGIDNPLFKIEGPAHTSIYNFSAKPNELALNEKGLTYCTQGRISDAMRSYQEAVRRDPDYLEPYWNLYTLLSTMPGKQVEGMRYADYMMAMKSLYVRKWMKRGIQQDHADWMLRCMDNYRSTLKMRAELLSRLSAKGDVWAYYKMTVY
jgi:hypothetical protein